MVAEAGQGRRVGETRRQTSETNIYVRMDLDGSGDSRISTGIGFFDHVLAAMAKHGLFDLEVEAQGDLHIDGHHTVEDVGIVLGQVIQDALGQKVGVRRFGTCFAPMDEALVQASLDLSGRPYLAYSLETDSNRVGEYDVCLTQEFFRAIATQARMTLHLRQLAGANHHHVIEAAFKAFGRALNEATRLDSRIVGVPSTKGTLG